MVRAVSAVGVERRRPADLRHDSEWPKVTDAVSEALPVMYRVPSHGWCDTGLLYPIPTTRTRWLIRQRYTDVPEGLCRNCEAAPGRLLWRSTVAIAAWCPPAMVTMPVTASMRRIALFSVSTTQCYPDGRPDGLRRSPGGSQGWPPSPL